MERLPADSPASNTTISSEKLTFNDTIDTTELVHNFLTGEGVDIEAVKRMPVEQRSPFLIKKLIIDNGLESEKVPNTVTIAPRELGLIIIKPEILPGAKRVINFLDEVGIRSQILDSIFPSKKEWLDTYGYMLKKYPDVINIYIMQRALGVQPIVFEHLEAATYASMVSKRPESYLATDDQDMLFDRLFCGQAYGELTSTIRSSVSLPIMQQLGFETFSGYATGFDPYNFYKDGGADNVFRAYNGVHIPSNASEKARNFNSFIMRGDD